MEYENRMKLEFDSRSANEGFARVAVAAFLSQMNPTLEEVADVKTALSEAVTNCVVHAYEGKVEKITVECMIRGHGAAFHDKAGFRALRHGLCLYGGFHGFRGGGVKARRGHESGDEKKDRKNSE